MPQILSDYLGEVLTPSGLDRAARRVVAKAKKEGLEFDAVAFSGMSGALVGPIVAMRTKTYPIFVRKSMKAEAHHSGRRVEGAFGTPLRYIIVDDFVSSGKTIRRIVQEVGKVSGATCVGAVLYKSNSGVRSVRLPYNERLRLYHTSRR